MGMVKRGGRKGTKGRGWLEQEQDSLRIRKDRCRAEKEPEHAESVQWTHMEQVEQAEDFIHSAMEIEQEQYSHSD